MKLKTFTYDWIELEVEFVETSEVTEGVKCDVYRFVWDDTKDLWIIRIQPWCETPKQLVVWWEKTIEWYISGNWWLIVVEECDTKWHRVKEWEIFETEVQVWDIMQWVADSDSELIAYEVCFPPCSEWRFVENSWKEWEWFVFEWYEDYLDLHK